MPCEGRLGRIMRSGFSDSPGSAARPEVCCSRSPLAGLYMSFDLGVKVRVVIAPYEGSQRQPEDGRWHLGEVSSSLPTRDRNMGGAPSGGDPNRGRHRSLRGIATVLT